MPHGRKGHFDSRVKKIQFIRPSSQSPASNSIAVCTPTPEYEAGRLRILGSRQAHLELWPLAKYDTIGRVSCADSLDTILDHSSTGTTSPAESERLQLIWRDLSYNLPVRTGMCCGTERQVLKRMSGQVNDGSLAALMGPSGAGKSTLLNCIAGKIRDHVRGQVFLRFPSSWTSDQRRDVRMSFVPQKDAMFMNFTVRETIMFSSRLNSGIRHPLDRKWNIQETLAHLDLVSVADVRLDKLSGGQLKKTSIAIELVTNPSILLLDEPTTGLDSESSEKLIQLLKQLTQRPDAPMIVTSIHQLPHSVFNLFDTVCLLNHCGENIYFGSPYQAVEFFAEFGFERKPDTNPADFMIEIANGKKQFDICYRMAASTRDSIIDTTTFAKRDVPVCKFKHRNRSSCLLQFGLLFMRSFRLFSSHSRVLVTQLLANAVFVLLVFLLPSEPVGQYDGCWRSLINLTIMDGNSSAGHIPESMETNLAQKITHSSDVSIFMFALVIHLMFLNLITSLSNFTSEFRVLVREKSNNWYSVFAYFLASTTCNIISIVISSGPVILVSYFAGEMPADDWRRFTIFCGVCLLQSVIWSSRGSLCSLFFPEEPVIAMTIGTLFAATTIFFSGLIVPLHKIDPILKPFIGVSDIKYEVSALMIGIYGYDRCSGGEDVSNLIRHVMKQPLPMTRTENVAPLLLNETEHPFPMLSSPDPQYLFHVQEAMTDYYNRQGPLVDESDFQPSFLLDVNHIQENDMTYNLVYLMLMFLVARMFVYVSLKVRTMPNRL